MTCIKDSWPLKILIPNNIVSTISNHLTLNIIHMLEMVIFNMKAVSGHERWLRHIDYQLWHIKNLVQLFQHLQLQV